MNKRIEWLSGERILPTIGHVVTGSIIEAPIAMADGYISQGEAKEVKSVIPRNKVREGEDK